jgi:hypothetical protein
LDIPMTYPHWYHQHFQWKPPAAPSSSPWDSHEAMSLRQPLASVISARFRDRPWGGNRFFNGWDGWKMPIYEWMKTVGLPSF